MTHAALITSPTAVTLCHFNYRHCLSGIDLVVEAGAAKLTSVFYGGGRKEGGGGADISAVSQLTQLSCY